MVVCIAVKFGLILYKSSLRTDTCFFYINSTRSISEKYDPRLRDYKCLILFFVIPPTIPILRATCKLTPTPALLSDPVIFLKP